MAHFYKLQWRMGEVAKEYFRKTQDASKYLAKEHDAVVRIQSFNRGARVRNTWHAVIDGTRLIQRVSRGWLARTKTKGMRLNRSRRLKEHFFHHCAAVIQKFFRGWWSRKHLHHFHGRKRYLESVEKRGEYTKDWLQGYHKRQLAEARQQEEQQMKKEFNDLAGELHHLVSTKAIAGVYNPPYSDALPEAFDKPIEQHLRDALQVETPKGLRRLRRRSASPCLKSTASTTQVAPSQREQQEFQYAGPPQDLPNRTALASRSASVGYMQKIQGPFRSREQIEVASVKSTQMHRTIQAGTPYGLMDEDRKMQQRLTKLMRVSPIDFVAPGLPPERQPPSSVHTNVPYRERPAELRNEYTELPKIRDKPPFFTAMPHDKHFAEYNERPLLANGHI